MRSFELLALSHLVDGGTAYLWHQSLEERCDSFILNHASNNLETALWVVKVSVLNTGLDNIERSRDDEGG
jgi:hypothetical protein